MKIKFLQIVFVFTLSLGLNAQEMLPFVENFTKTIYEGDNQVWNVTQGDDNAMYFANNHFFIRYNGVKWEKYTLPNKTIIRSVFAFKDRIYCGSYNEFGYWKRIKGVMKYYSMSKNKNFFKEISNNEEIWKIFEFQGKIYFQSFNEIFIYDNNKTIEIKIPFQISYCFPQKDKLYVASVDRGVFILKDTKFIKLNIWSSINNSIIHSIEEHNGKTYLFTKKEGVFVFENGKLEPWKNALNFNFKSELIITAKFIDKNRVAIGTAFKGLYVIDLRNNTFYNISRNNSLTNNSVLSINFDKENDLWLGMDNGIAHIEINSPFLNLTDTSGILGSVYTVEKTSNGFLLGTNHGVFEYENKKLNFVLGSQGQVWQINKVKNKLIIGHNDGTYSYENKNFKKINLINGGWKLFKSNYDERFFQSNYSGIVVYDNYDFSSYKRIEGLTKPIRNINQNKKNELWAVDNYKSLYRIQFNDDYKTTKVENITQINGIKNDFNVKLFNYKNEMFFYIQNIWYQYDRVSDKLVESKLFNLFFKDISEIVPIDEYSFLVIKQGLFYIVHQKGERFLCDLIPKKYYDGKIINEDTKVIKEHNKLIINLDDGFLTFVPRENNIATQKIIIEGFYEGNLISEDSQINYNQSVELNVITPYYGFNKPSLFYKLNNSSTYTPINKGKIILNNLTSGNQEVKIYYNNSDDFEKTATYSFSVSRPWYFSIGAILLYFVIIAGSFFTYYRWNKIRYIEKIKLKDEELKHQKEIFQLELDADSKLKIQEYEKHILEIQIQTKASEVAGKSLSIAKQSEMIEEIKKLLENENDISSLKSNIKKTIKLNSINKKEWETFENNLFKSHEDFIKRLSVKYANKLSSKDIKLCIYLKMSLSSKEIAPLMNISFRGVELHRYRLRKKLDINQETNLSSFINNI